MNPLAARIVAREGGRLVVELEGELDLATAQDLMRELDAAATPDTMTVELRVGDLTFIDSAGLGVLVRLHNRLTARDGGQPLVVVDPNRQARKVLEITGLMRVFSVVESKPEG